MTPLAPLAVAMHAILMHGTRQVQADPMHYEDQIGLNSLNMNSRSNLFALQCGISEQFHDMRMYIHLFLYL